MKNVKADNCTSVCVLNFVFRKEINLAPEIFRKEKKSKLLLKMTNI